MIHDHILSFLGENDWFHQVHLQHMLLFFLFLGFVKDFRDRISKVWLSASLLNTVLQVVALNVLVGRVESSELSLESLEFFVLKVRILAFELFDLRFLDFKNICWRFLQASRIILEVYAHLLDYVL